jgi:phage repressor protein C with HTH and peptisase S24 domain
LASDGVFCSPEDAVSARPRSEPRDRIIVDTTKLSLAEPGLFVLWDGGGLVCKWVERVPGSEPAMLCIMSENPRFQPYDIPAEQARIVGRVVWFARRI